jgi:hypothetical protein
MNKQAQLSAPVELIHTTEIEREMENGFAMASVVAAKHRLQLLRGWIHFISIVNSSTRKAKWDGMQMRGKLNIIRGEKPNLPWRQQRRELCDAGASISRETFKREILPSRVGGSRQNNCIQSSDSLGKLHSLSRRSQRLCCGRYRLDRKSRDCPRAEAYKMLKRVCKSSGVYATCPARNT